MIRFNKKISLQQTRMGEWRLISDRNDQFDLLQITHTSEHNSITRWWDMQHQSELRRWQKDIFIQELSRLGHGDDFVLWVPYRRGQGHSQPHDICLVYHLKHKIWILSLQEYHWLIPSNMYDCEFHIDQALCADILTRQGRDQIYMIIDELNTINYKLCSQN